MITTSQMYWLTRLDTIHELTQGLAILGTIAFVILCIIAGILTMTAGSTEEHYRAGVMRKCWYGSMFVLAVSASLYAFTPTTKEMAAIIIIPRLANSNCIRLPSST